MGRLCFSFFVAVFLLIPAVPQETRASGDSPNSAVSDFQALLISTMKAAEQTTVRERYEKLLPGVSKAFHIPLMTQISTGQYWKPATNDERSQAVMGFTRMSVSTLATLFDGYSGETFEYRATKDGPSNTKLVITDLVKSDKSTINITYVTRKFKKGWQIMDVIVDGGISELMVRRSEYRLVLKERGIPGLISLLNAKADELMSR